VVNREAVGHALRAALALNCEIAATTWFDRKNYYYPDLPKNYQVSQNYSNLGAGGSVEVAGKGFRRRVRIHNVHMEEDAGKSVHEEGGTATLVDLNRTGTPLLEIVTEPDMRGLDELEAFMELLAAVLRYAGVAACRMEEGGLRFEVSVSLRPEKTEPLGSRVEVKNLNSMKNVLAATRFEIERQRKLLDAGEPVARETRLWDDAAGRSRRMRGKELAHDYRYFPEPDLVRVTLSEEEIARARAALPELPDARARRFVEAHGLPPYDAQVLTQEKAVADYFEACAGRCGRAKDASNWVMGEVLRLVKETGRPVDAVGVTPEALAELIGMVAAGKVNAASAKAAFAAMAETGKSAGAIVEERGLKAESDEGALGGVIAAVIEEHADAAADYRKGKQNALNFLKGQVMRRTRGKAAPAVVQKLLEEALSG
jgi:aspartyl-tRNA(Asn)/glutamyl-tRNA(Gln) amidotransferase subunit B